MRRICANCGVDVAGRARTGNRGPDIAWMNHCLECAALVDGQVRQLDPRPSGSPIDLWQCTSCKTVRACRPRWRTRCPVCLDQRTVMDEATVAGMRILLRARGVRSKLAQRWQVPARQLTTVHALMAESSDYLVDLGEQYARPGWTVLASDVRGMPWGDRNSAISHGTWASHDRCRTVQKITLARAECRTCPPEPDSRTHRAKADQPHYLYLVRYLDLLKFGHGDANRIRAHLRVGAEVVKVLRGTHANVVGAEQQMKWALHDRLIDPRYWDLPSTFGAGSEVVTDDVGLNLCEYLTGAGITDYTARFR